MSTLLRGRTFVYIVAALALVPVVANFLRLRIPFAAVLFGLLFSPFLLIALGWILLTLEERIHTLFGRGFIVIGLGLLGFLGWLLQSGALE